MTTNTLPEPARAPRVHASSIERQRQTVRTVLETLPGTVASLRRLLEAYDANPDDEGAAGAAGVELHLVDLLRTPLFAFDAPTASAGR